MKIESVRATPLLVPYKAPYYWAQGVVEGASVILVEIGTDEGLVGYGESVGTPTASGIISFIEAAAESLIGKSPFQHAALLREAYHRLFQAQGTCSSPRFAGQVFTGMEMALWDLVGKKCGLPVCDLMGGAVRDELLYFGFAQGDDPDEIARHAGELAASGCKVIYVKVGRDDDLDSEIVRKVREAIGPRKRLRVDPNEHWHPLRALRLAREFAEFGVEMIEQPTACENMSALAQVSAASPIAIAADQAVFTPADAYDMCRASAAQMIVIGLHETGGLTRFKKIADIAEAAGINICIHGLYETGITTCAANQVAATVANLDDGNQYMNHFLEWDIISKPDLTLDQGRLPVFRNPGLGFEIDADAVKEAARLHREAEEGKG